MTLNWQQHPEAELQLTEAHDLYLETGGSDLSDRFSDRVEAAVDLIVTWPQAPPRVFTERSESVIRALRVTGFPYSLVYTVYRDEILVLAYAHEKRRPGYWLNRLHW